MRIWWAFLRLAYRSYYRLRSWSYKSLLLTSLNCLRRYYLTIWCTEWENDRLWIFDSLRDVHRSLRYWCFCYFWWWLSYFKWCKNWAIDWVSSSLIFLCCSFKVYLKDNLCKKSKFETFFSNFFNFSELTFFNFSISCKFSDIFRYSSISLNVVRLLFRDNLSVCACWSWLWRLSWERVLLSSKEFYYRRIYC